MRKAYLATFAAALALFASCAKQSDLVKLEETVNGLKSNEIAMLKNSTTINKTVVYRKHGKGRIVTGQEARILN